MSIESHILQYTMDQNKQFIFNSASVRGFVINSDTIDIYNNIDFYNYERHRSLIRLEKNKIAFELFNIQYIDILSTINMINNSIYNKRNNKWIKKVIVYRNETKCHIDTINNMIVHDMEILRNCDSLLYYHGQIL